MLTLQDGPWWEPRPHTFCPPVRQLSPAPCWHLRTPWAAARPSLGQLGLGWGMQLGGEVSWSQNLVVKKWTQSLGGVKGRGSP